MTRPIRANPQYVQVSAFLNGGIAEDADPRSAFRLGGGLRLRAELPYMLHGYNVEEIFARRFLLVNLDGGE